MIHVLVRQRRRRVFLLPERRNASYDQQVAERGAQPVRLLCVVAVVPSRIETNVVDHNLAHHAVAAGDFDGQAGKQKHRIEIAGIRFAPHETFHAPHRRANKQMNVIHLQSLGKKYLRRAHHV